MKFSVLGAVPFFSKQLNKVYIYKEDYLSEEEVKFLTDYVRY